MTYTITPISSHLELVNAYIWATEATAADGKRLEDWLEFGHRWTVKRWLQHLAAWWVYDVRDDDGVMVGLILVVFYDGTDKAFLHFYSQGVTAREVVDLARIVFEKLFAQGIDAQGSIVGKSAPTNVRLTRLIMRGIDNGRIRRTKAKGSETTS